MSARQKRHALIPSTLIIYSCLSADPRAHYRGISSFYVGNVDHLPYWLMQHFLGSFFWIYHNNCECLKISWRLSVMVKHNFIVFCKHSRKMPLYVIGYGPSIECFVLLSLCRLNGPKEREVQIFELDKPPWM